MSDTATSSDAAGACWFCGRGRGGADSLAFPFWSNSSDDVRVLVVPRCADCTQFHRRQQFPSIAIVGACAIPPTAVARLLPLSEGPGTAVTVITFLTGLAIGIVIVSSRERRAAERLGTKPAHAVMEHAGYQALNGDTAGWRQQSGPAMGATDRVTARRETIGDYAAAFRNDAKALAALEQGCRDAGVPPPARAGTD